MAAVKRLKPLIITLEKTVIQKSSSGEDPKMLSEKVFKLADLRAEATMAHLNCIYKTKKILTQDQLDILE